MPDLPTVAESCLPGLHPIFWIGVLAPERTPAPSVEKISKDIADMVNLPEVRKKPVALGATPLAKTPGQFHKIIDDDNGG